MKNIITSLLRHALTALAGFGALAASHGWINPEDAPAVNASGAIIGEAFVVILTAVVARFLMIFWPDFFKNTDLGNGGGMATVLLCMLTGFMVFSSSSCTPFSPESPVPVRACYETKKGRVCYGSEGLSVELHSAK